MLPFETPTIFEQLPRFIFQMPRVVTDQKAKFENDELFRKLSRETEIRYTAYRDRPIEERQIRFINGCREGHTDVSFTATGTNLQLVFNPCVGAAYFTATDHCDFEKEKGKVHIRSSMIFDGVCIRWRGWIDLERLDGIGCLEYDEDRGRIEEAILKEQIEQYKMRMREFEERQRLYKLAQAEHQKKLPPQTTTPTSQLTPPINGLTAATAAHHHHHHHSLKQSSSPAGKTELRKHHIENILNASGAPELTTGASKKH